MTWADLDWEVLDRLRETFLAGPASRGPYWTSRADLANYDFTFAQRIGWKCDAVLADLQRLGWTPPATDILDWGCGSGIAHRCVLDAFGSEKFTTVRVFDQSPQAMEFAAQRAKQRFPHLEVAAVDSTWLAGSDSIGLLVISHVINELTAEEQAALRHVLSRAQAVLWVEPGTHEASRLLGGFRDALRVEFEIVAPCTHAAACGALIPGRERDWCHFFANPPSGVLGDSSWVRFGQMAGIDLRSLPYSYLVLERKGLREPRPGRLPEGCSRLLGRPRVYKGYARLDSCQAEGLEELTLQKRDLPDVFKQFKKGESGGVYRWERDGDLISGGGTVDHSNSH